MADLREELDDIERLIRDVRIALDFRETLDADNGRIDLVRWGSGKSVFVTMSPEDIAAVDSEIEDMSARLKSKVAGLTTHRKQN